MPSIGIKNDYAGVMSRVVNGSSTYSIYGNTDSQIVVCGHSHVVSILEATIDSKNIVAGESTISLCYSTNWASWQLPGGHEYWDLVAKSGRGKNIVIVWQGNQHNADFMFQSDPSFTIAGLKDEKLNLNSIPIPRAMLRDFFRPSFEELKEIIPRMSDAASITFLNGPAPKPLSHIQSFIHKERYFTDLAEKLQINLNDLVITSDALRLELWKILTGMLKNYASMLGVNFIDAPPESRDSFGMLMPEYWASDVTHANPQYGSLLIEKLTKMKEGLQN